MSTWAVVPAAGTGERMGGGGPKALRTLAGVPLVVHVVRVLGAAADGVVVAGPDDVLTAAGAAGATGVEGGETRQASVRRALEALPADTDVVVVHDAARPLVTGGLVRRVVAALAGADAAIAALPVTDTIKRVAGEAVEETVRRDGLWRAQTPQAFRAALLRDAHARAEAEGATGTDDAALVERLGVKPAIVLGEERNIKITTEADLALAEALLRAEAER